MATTNALIARKAAELAELEREAARIADEIEARKDAIKAWLGDREDATAGNWRIRWTRYTTTRLDAKALRADHPDIADIYTRASEARRFSIA